MKSLCNAIIIFLFLSATAVVSPRASSLRMDGDVDKSIRHEAISLSERMLKTGRSRAAVLDSVIAVLTAEGYLDATGQNADSVTAVVAGARYRLRRILFEGDSVFSIEMDRPFSRRVVNAQIDSVVRNLSQRGYYFGQAAVVKVKRSGIAVTLIVRLQAGPAVVLSENRILGLKHTRPAVVQRYLPGQDGDLVTDKLVTQSAEAARRIDFVDLQVSPRVVPRPGFTSAAIEYRFVEKKQVRVSGGAGIIPDDATGAVWNLDLSLLSPFGGGRRLAFLSERREEGRSFLNIRYRQPSFVIAPGYLELSVATRNYRDQFYEFHGSADYRLQVSGALGVGLGLGWKRVEPALDEPPYTRYEVSFLVSRRPPAAAFNPGKAFLLDWRISYAHRRYVDDTAALAPRRAVLNETRNSMLVASVLPVVNPVILFMRAKYDGLETSERLPPVSELFFIGGPPYLRGFRNDQFLAQRAALITIEPRLRFASGYLLAFYEGAYINRPVSDREGLIHTDVLYRNGYGVGLGLANLQRSLRLSFGWNRELSLNQPRLSIEFSSAL